MERDEFQVAIMEMLRTRSEESREIGTEILKELKRLNENFERFLQRHDLSTPLPVSSTLEIMRLARRTPEQIKADNKIILREAKRIKKSKPNESE